MENRLPEAISVMKSFSFFLSTNTSYLDLDTFTVVWSDSADTYCISIIGMFIQSMSGTPKTLGLAPGLRGVVWQPISQTGPSVCTIGNSTHPSVRTLWLADNTGPGCPVRSWDVRKYWHRWDSWSSDRQQSNTTQITLCLPGHNPLNVQLMISIPPGFSLCFPFLWCDVSAFTIMPIFHHLLPCVLVSHHPCLLTGGCVSDNPPPIHHHPHPNSLSWCPPGGAWGWNTVSSIPGKVPVLTGQAGPLMGVRGPV